MVYRILGLEKSYGDRFTLRVPALTIERGDFMAVIGPSGAGKSTLLRLLNFLEEPDRGSIHFLGREIRKGQDVPLQLRRRVTTVFQRPVLLNRSVRANIAYGLKLRGRQKFNRQVEAMVEAMRLTELADQPARSLSGGEAQRVALARAMLLEPETLLLDEPTANLDPYNVAMIEATIRQLNQSEGTTIVLVTHNLFQARRLARKVLLLIDGRLIQQGTAADFFDHPADPQVKAFVQGEMVY